MDTSITFPTDDSSTAEAKPLLLADMERLNPEAFNFDDIPLPNASTSAEMDRGMMTLEKAIGDYTEVKPNLYVKSPKLRQQRAILKTLIAIDAAKNDPEKVLDLLIPLGMQFFFVPDGRDGFRGVTEGELLDSLRAGEIKDLCLEHAGLSEGEV